jgi:hypothetical protein
MWGTLITTAARSRVLVQDKTEQKRLRAIGTDMLTYVTAVAEQRVRSCIVRCSYLLVFIVGLCVIPSAAALFKA